MYHISTAQGTTDSPLYKMLSRKVNVKHALAASFEHGETFIVTVHPKDLPECWGMRLSEIHLPSSEIDLELDIDLEALTEEITQNGIPQRRFCKTKDGKKKRFESQSFPHVVCREVEPK